MEKKVAVPLPSSTPAGSVPTLAVTGISTGALVGETAVTVRKNRKNIVAAGSGKKNDREGKKNVAADESDPVSLPTGEFTYDNALLSLPGGGMPLHLDLTYRSFLDYDGPVGNKFTHNYDAYLTGSVDEMRYYDGKFGTYSFAYAGSEYAYNSAIKARLSANADGTFALKHDDGSETDF